MKNKNDRQHDDKIHKVMHEIVALVKGMNVFEVLLIANIIFKSAINDFKENDPILASIAAKDFIQACVEQTDLILAETERVIN